MLIDTHCHLASHQYDQLNANQRADLIKRARAQGINQMITLGAHTSDWIKNLQWAEQYPNIVFAALGVHPNDAALEDSDWYERLDAIAQQFPLAAIGETGLDYFHSAPKGIDEKANKQIQWATLEKHFELAKKHKLNIVLHTRDRQGSASFDDTMAIAKQFAGIVRPVFHCFIGTGNQATQIFDELDGLVSFTGVVTFSNASNVADVARWCPLDKLMVETDSPYLSPIPLRGKQNEPSHMIHTAQFIADEKNISFDEFADQTTKTAQDFFRLSPIK